MMTKFILPVALLILATDGLTATRIKCAEAPHIVLPGTTLNDYSSFLSANNIILKTNVDLSHLEQFKNELEKFPAPLRQELVRAGNSIHIMEGSGVTVDPTWLSSDEATFDGRPWSEVPGAGGTTARGYAKVPTRIVINHLYDHHGSANVILHEHGHSLDSIRELQGISHSNIWADVLADEPGNSKFLSEICGTYCTANIEEAFAEYFANYHACPERRAQMEAEVPHIAEFFRRFQSTKKLENIWSDEAVSEEITEPVPPPRRESRGSHARRRLRDLFGKIIPNIGE
jgi:hypothetical protein